MIHDRQESDIGGDRLDLPGAGYSDQDRREDTPDEHEFPAVGKPVLAIPLFLHTSLRPSVYRTRSIS